MIYLFKMRIFYSILLVYHRLHRLNPHDPSAEHHRSRLTSQFLLSTKTENPEDRRHQLMTMKFDGILFDRMGFYCWFYSDDNETGSFAFCDSMGFYCWFYGDLLRLNGIWVSSNMTSWEIPKLNGHLWENNATKWGSFQQARVHGCVWKLNISQPGHWIRRRAIYFPADRKPCS